MKVRERGEKVKREGWGVSDIVGMITIPWGEIASKATLWGGSVSVTARGIMSAIPLEALVARGVV